MLSLHGHTLFKLSTLIMLQIIIIAHRTLELLPLKKPSEKGSEQSSAHLLHACNHEMMHKTNTGTQ